MNFSIVSLVECRMVVYWCCHQSSKSKLKLSKTIDVPRWYFTKMRDYFKCTSEAASMKINPMKFGIHNKFSRLMKTPCDQLIEIIIIYSKLVDTCVGYLAALFGSNCNDQIIQYIGCIRCFAAFNISAGNIKNENPLNTNKASNADRNAIFG